MKTNIFDAAAPSQSYEISNLGLSVIGSAGSLTVALKQANGTSDPTPGVNSVKIGMRSPTAATGSYTQYRVQAALSLLISSGTTLGVPAATNTHLWIYAINSDGAGTIKLGVSTSRHDDQTLQSTVKESFTGTVTIASPAVWTATNHGLNNGDAIRLATTGALPTGFTSGVTYFVVSSATNTFSLAATSEGAAINTTGTQSGMHTISIAGSRLASDGVYSAKPIRLIGRAVVNLVTPGTWLTPTELSLTNLSATVDITTADLSANANITGSQLSPTAGILGPQLANQTITATQIANATVTTTQIAAGTIAITNMGAANFGGPTASSGGFATTAGAGVVAVTNLSQTITTVANRLVKVYLISDNVVQAQVGPNSGSLTGNLYLFRGPTQVGIYNITAGLTGPVAFLDVGPPTGLQTYSIKAEALTSGEFFVKNVQLVVMQD